MRRSAAELEAAGVAFVEATVVRCAHPTIARPGDRAIVFGDGTIDGFLGGACADASVRLQALRALETGDPVLLRILPGAEDGPSDEEGAVVVANPCLSGGALELFLEPHLPAPSVAVAGDSPIARALVELAGPLGFRVRVGAVAEPGDFGAVVASLGRGDEEALRAALEAGCEYVGLVASRRRGGAVLNGLRAAGVAEDALARVRTPAGVDIGARTHAEIALAILAELVAVRRAPAVPPGDEAAEAPVPVGDEAAEAPVPVGDEVAVARVPAGDEVATTAAVSAGDEVATTAAVSAGDEVAGARPLTEAVDPVCGMLVAVGPQTPTAGGHAFCCDGCRDAWLARAR